MKTTNVDFGTFAQDAMSITEMNFLRGGGDPGDLLIPPGEERPTR